MFDSDDRYISFGKHRLGINTFGFEFAVPRPVLIDHLLYHTFLVGERTSLVLDNTRDNLIYLVAFEHNVDDILV